MANLLLIIQWTFLGISFLSFGINDPVKEKKPGKNPPIEKPLTTIAFGSSNQQHLPQPLWADIIVNKPQLWIWLGGVVRQAPTDLETLKEKYTYQLQEPGYSALKESTPIIGTWDYTDYGQKEICKEYAQRSESQSLFCDFLGEAPDSPLRGQEGIYTARTYGPKGQQVKVILLDTRFHRSAPQEVAKGKQSKKKPDADILGEAQWKWLEKEVSQSSAELTIIGTGTPLIPGEHQAENWSDYPTSRERMLKLISKAQGVIFLSGERNLAEISTLEVKGCPKPVFEVTSSGLTHTVGRDYKIEPNTHRVGNAVAKKNFGLIQIDWEKREASLQIHGERNTQYISQVMAF